MEHRETDQGNVSNQRHDTDPLGRKLEAHQGHAGVSSTRGNPCMLIPQSVSPKSLQTLLLLKKSPETAQCQGTQARQDYLCQYTDVSPGFTHCAFPCGSYSHLSFIITPHCFLIIQFMSLFLSSRVCFYSAAKCAQNPSGCKTNHRFSFQTVQLHWFIIRSGAFHSLAHPHFQDENNDKRIKKKQFCDQRSSVSTVFSKADI